VVFALAKGVAAVVACAACLFLSVLMIVAKTILASATIKYGLLPLFALFIITLAGRSGPLTASPQAPHAVERA
jgi:hypothetical protein